MPDFYMSAGSDLKPGPFAFAANVNPCLSPHRPSPFTGQDPCPANDAAHLSLGLST